MSRTEVEDIRQWFLAGIEKGATHMVVFVDRFDHEDYPSYVMPGQDPREFVRSTLASAQMTGLMEVYHLGMEMEAQLAEGRVVNYDLDPARAAAPAQLCRQRTPMQNTPTPFADLAAAINASAEAAKQELQEAAEAERLRREAHRQLVAKIFVDALSNLPKLVKAAAVARRPTCTVLEWGNNSHLEASQEAAEKLEEYFRQQGVRTSRACMETTELYVDLADLLAAAQKAAQSKPTP